MPEEAAFLEAILAAPDDDTLRLVYADWLEERGDPKGEFIRLQCAHAATWHEALSVSGDPQCQRMRFLEKEYGDRWLEGVPKPSNVRWHLWRGLPSWVEVPGWQEFHRHAERWFRVAPVEYVTFECLSLVGARALARSPYLERIRVLDLAYDGIRKIGALRALLDSPSLKNLRTLRLSKGGIGDDVAMALASCPYLEGLKLLSLYSSDIDDAGAMAIARSPYLRNVGFIDLCRNRFGEAAEQELRERFGGRVNT
jgi:uncharacterized protein (TIGR02996 family)